MSSEIGSVGFDEFDLHTDDLLTQEAPTSNWHEAIFSQELNSKPFTKNAALQTPPADLTHRTNKVAHAHGMNLVAAKVDGSGSGGVKIGWGGKNGNEISCYMEGEIRDDKGNSAQVRVEGKNDGTGSAEVSVKHDEYFDKTDRKK